MFYAWNTASDFGNGKPAVARGQSQNALTKKMFKEHKAFFSAYQLDGAWVDLTTFGPAGNTEGREVSEDRTKRYIRSRARRMEENGDVEVGNSAPLREEIPTPEPERFEPEQPQMHQVALSVDPSVVKAIYEFLALEDNQREAAINALTALSVSAEPFKRAVAVMLDDDAELIVGFGQPVPAAQEVPDEN